MNFCLFLVAYGIAINLNFVCYSFLFKLIVYTVLKINTTTTGARANVVLITYSLTYLLTHGILCTSHRIIFAVLYIL